MIILINIFRFAKKIFFFQVYRTKYSHLAKVAVGNWNGLNDSTTLRDTQSKSMAAWPDSGNPHDHCTSSQEPSSFKISSSPATTTTAASLPSTITRPPSLGTLLSEPSPSPSTLSKPSPSITTWSSAKECPQTTSPTHLC